MLAWNRRQTGNQISFKSVFGFFPPHFFVSLDLLQYDNVFGIIVQLAADKIQSFKSLCYINSFYNI